MSFWGYSNPPLSSRSYPAPSTGGPPEPPSCKAACNGPGNTFLKKTGTIDYLLVIQEQANTADHLWCSGGNRFEHCFLYDWNKINLFELTYGVDTVALEEEQANLGFN